MKAFLMEPMIPGDDRDELSDLALELVSKASALAGQVHGQVQEGIGDLVRSMNCYYSNLIEGHNTHPRDIEQHLYCSYKLFSLNSVFSAPAPVGDSESPNTYPPCWGLY